MSALILAQEPKSYNTPEQSSQYAECNGVIDGTINIIWQEVLLPYIYQKLTSPSNAT